MRSLILSCLLLAGCPDPNVPTCEQGGTLIACDGRMPGRAVGFLQCELADETCTCAELAQTYGAAHPDAVDVHGCPLFAVGPDDPDQPTRTRLHSCDEVDGTEPIPTGLARFCLLEFDEATPSSWVGEKIDAVVEPDLAVITPAAFLDELPGWLDQRFAAEVGSAGASGVPSPVRLTLVDNLPSGSIGGPGHGGAMAEIAASILGVSAPHAELHQRLALPFALDGSEPRWSIDDGGAFGSVAWLAQAIRRETIAWQADRAHPDLILNLSLGWNPAETPNDITSAGKWPNGELGGEDPGLVALYAALRDAQCRGALIVAAAGNQAGGCEADGVERCEGPLLPAAWGIDPVGFPCEQLMPPGEVRLRPVPVPDGVATGPLLFAVSAVGEHGAPLAISRPDSTSPFHAFGDHAIVNNNGEVEGVTGTSVSAVVASASAAIRWSVKDADQPGSVTAWEVMAQLHSEGATPINVEGPYPGNIAGLGSKSARIDACVADPSCTQASSAGDAPELEQGSLAFELVGVGATCPSGAQAHAEDAATGVADDTCPFDDVGSATDRLWLGPQPPSEGCDLCAFAVEDTKLRVAIRYTTKVRGALDAQKEGGAVVAMAGTVRVQTSAGTTTSYTFPLDVGQAISGTLQVIDLTVPAVNDAVRGDLTTVVDINGVRRSYASELTLVPWP